MIKKAINNILTVLIVVLFGWVIYNNIDDFEILYDTIQTSNLIFLILASIFGILAFVIFKELIVTSYWVISERKSFPRLFSKSIVYHFLNISNPLGVAGGTAYLINYFIERGLSHIKAVFGMLITHLSTNLAFLIILSITLYNLNESDKLGGYQIFASSLIFTVTALFILLILFFVTAPQFSERIAARIVKAINFLTLSTLRKELIPLRPLYEYRDHARELSKNFWMSFSRFLLSIPLSLLFHIINMIVLYLSFEVFEVSLPLSKLVTLYGVITLFTIVSPTPQGVGIVEGLAHSAAVSVGISGSVSLLAILAYRLAIVWIPALVGLVLFKFPYRKKIEDIT